MRYLHQSSAFNNPFLISFCRHKSGCSRWRSSSSPRALRRAGAAGRGAVVVQVHPRDLGARARWGVEARGRLDAVGAKGAVFFCQLWHAAPGAGDATWQRHLVSPQMSFDGSCEELTSPRRVAVEDVSGVVDAFRRVARKAMDAGWRAWDGGRL
ncbi:hypothetical protein ACQJBY_008295 [Aegilops geniculata]